MDPRDKPSPAQPQFDWKAVLSAAGTYPREAFEFVREGLHVTVSSVLVHAHAGGEGFSTPDSHHVSGQQLAIGLREHAIERFGMLAPAVLRHWNVLRTEDFGRIVYAMIDSGLLSKTADDSIEDFAGVYEFDEAFGSSQLAARVGRR